MDAAAKRSEPSWDEEETFMKGNVMIMMKSEIVKSRADRRQRKTINRREAKAEKKRHDDDEDALIASNTNGTLEHMRVNDGEGPSVSTSISISPSRYSPTYVRRDTAVDADAEVAVDTDAAVAGVHGATRREIEYADVDTETKVWETL